MVWDVCARIDADFEVKDSAALYKKAFAKMRRVSAAKGDPLPSSMIPLTPRQTLRQCGLWFCFNAERWEEGLRLILVSGDTEWGSVAEMEAANPQKASEGYEAWPRMG